MKYLWSNKNVQNSMNMQAGHEDFVIRTEYNLKMMENIQQTSPKKIKRFRSAFTTDQVNYLEKQFKKFPYIGNAQRKEVAIALNIPERAVKIWFQNRRMKEKKETVKEFDDEQCNRKSLELTKDQLNNETLSANDRKPYSLPLLTDVNKTNCDNIKVTNNSPGGLSTGLLIADSGFRTLENGMTPDTVITPNVCGPTQPILRKNYLKSAEFSIDLCKKYKNESSNSPTYVKPLPAKEQDIKQNIEQKPMDYKGMEQLIPEDLSSSRKLNDLSASQTHALNIAPSNPGYISVIPTVSPFYAQPYYTASGVLWKPVSMMPSPVPGSSLPIANNVGPIPAVPEGVPKKCCSCDCHVKPMIPYNFQQQSPSPQYIITAVQFPNPSAPKF